MVDLLLINASHSFLETHTAKKSRGREFFRYPPLGMLYVAAACEQQDIEVVCIDAPAEGLDVVECAERVIGYEPKIVGISATTPQARSAVQLAHELRIAYGHKISIGFGGTHARLDQQFTDKYRDFDWILSTSAPLGAAYGEITVPKIIKKILNGIHVYGLVEAEQLDRNLDAIQYPARHLLDTNLYHMPAYTGKFTPLISARGCSFACSFCSIPSLSRIIRYRSAPNVRLEIEQCKRVFGIKNFQLVDDTFLLNREHSLAVIEAFKSNDVKWGFQTRVKLAHTLGEEIIKRCADAGVQEISLGIESSVESVRFRNGKDFTDQELRDVVDWCDWYGIDVAFFMMIGLIGDTKETLKKNVRYPVEVVQPSYLESHLCVPYVGTEIFDIGVREELFSSDIWDRWIRGEVDEQPIYVPPGLTLEQMQESQREAYRQFYFRPNYILRRAKRDIMSWSALTRDYRAATTLFSEFR